MRDTDRLARFDREARALAALSHPNIGAIYGVEDADTRRGLVLELVEGPTLEVDDCRRRLSVCRPAACSGLVHRSTSRRRPRGGSRARHRSSRSQTREHQDHAERFREGPRLRPCESDGRRRWPFERFGADDRTSDHTEWPRCRDARLYEPGAGARTRCRSTSRYLGLWVSPLRAPDDGARLRWSFGRRHHCRSHWPRARLDASSWRNARSGSTTAPTVPGEGRSSAGFGISATPDCPVSPKAPLQRPYNPRHFPWRSTCGRTRSIRPGPSPIGIRTCRATPTSHSNYGVTTGNSTKLARPGA
jgi:hypothetical protein